MILRGRSYPNAISVNRWVWSCCFNQRANSVVVLSSLSSADGDAPRGEAKSGIDKRLVVSIMKLLSRRVPLGSLWKGAGGRRHDAVIAALNVVLIALVYRMLSAAATAETDLFILYYQPWVPFLAMLWAWGLNVLYFERSGLRYDLCFDEGDRHNLLSGFDILRLSNVLTFGFILSAFAFLAFIMVGSLSAAAMQPIMLYVSALLVLVMPFPVLFRETRKYFSV